MRTLGLPILLLICAATGLTVGGLALFDPATLFLSNGVTLADDPNLLTDIRAAGGALFASGLLMLTSVFRPSLRKTALGFATLFFLGYGTGRTVSMLTDGLPSTTLIVTTALELAFGVICLWAFVKLKDH